MSQSEEEPLERQLRLLKISRKGQPFQQLSGSAENSLSRNWKCQLLGHLLPLPSASPQAILGAARRALNIIYEGDFYLVQADDNTMVLRFMNEIDKDRAFHRQSLILYNSLLVIAEWDGRTPIRDVIDGYLCRVQIQMKLPLLLTGELAKDFTKSVGGIAVIEGKRTFSFQKGKARAYFQIKSSKPLYTLAERTTSTSQNIVASFKYEKLRSVCYLCGMLDHSFASCVLRRCPCNKKLTRSQFKEDTHLWGDFVFASDWYGSGPGNIRPRWEKATHHSDNDDEAGGNATSQSTVPETPMTTLLIENSASLDQPPNKKRSRRKQCETSSRQESENFIGNQPNCKDN